MRMMRMRMMRMRMMRMRRNYRDRTPASPWRLLRWWIYLPPLDPTRGRRIYALGDIDAVDGIEEGRTDDGDDNDDGDDVRGS